MANVSVFDAVLKILSAFLKKSWSYLHRSTSKSNISLGMDIAIGFTI